MAILGKIFSPAIGLVSEAMASSKKKSASSAQDDSGGVNNSGNYNNRNDRVGGVNGTGSYNNGKGRADVVGDQQNGEVPYYEEEDEYDQDHSFDETHPITPVDVDEEQWELDEAMRQELGRGFIEPVPEDDVPADPTQVLNEFMLNHPLPRYEDVVAPPKLEFPVVLPQRRPGDKSRGFVRAYAPVLADYGIDQATFLDFLKTFHRASQSSAWLSVVNMAAAAASFDPSGLVMGVSIAVQVAVRAAMEVETRLRFVSLILQRDYQVRIPTN
jgi:hypothetical protein